MSSGYVYVRSEPSLWTVGFYASDGSWHPESDHGTSEGAAARVTSLNGGIAASPWYESHGNLALLVRWLVDRGYKARTIAEAVEKPWNYEDEFRAAVATRAHELRGDEHVVLYHDDDRAYCNDEKCDWSFPEREPDPPVVTAPVVRTDCCGVQYDEHTPLDEQELRDYPDAGVMHVHAIGDTPAPDQACRQALHRQGRCAVLIRYMGGRLCGEPTVSGDYCAEHAHDAHEDARVEKAENAADEARLGVS